MRRLADARGSAREKRRTRSAAARALLASGCAPAGVPARRTSPSEERHDRRHRRPIDSRAEFQRPLRAGLRRTRAGAAPRDRVGRLRISSTGRSTIAAVVDALAALGRLAHAPHRLRAQLRRARSAPAALRRVASPVVARRHCRKDPELEAEQMPTLCWSPGTSACACSIAFTIAARSHATVDITECRETLDALLQRSVEGLPGDDPRPLGKAPKAVYNHGLGTGNARAFLAFETLGLSDRGFPQLPVIVRTQESRRNMKTALLMVTLVAAVSFAACSKKEEDDRCRASTPLLRPSPRRLRPLPAPSTPPSTLPLPARDGRRSAGAGRRRDEGRCRQGRRRCQGCRWQGRRRRQGRCRQGADAVRR